MNRKNLRREGISKYKDKSLCNLREGLKIRSVHASSILIEWSAYSHFSIIDTQWVNGEDSPRVALLGDDRSCRKSGRLFWNIGEDARMKQYTDVLSWDRRDGVMTDHIRWGSKWKWQPGKAFSSLGDSQKDRLMIRCPVGEINRDGIQTLR